MNDHVMEKEEKLRAAMEAARSFLDRSESLLAYWRDGGSVFTGSSTSGAVRRASMELTRKLSAYRRPS
jgi:hypothetical protein